MNLNSQKQSILIIDDDSIIRKLVMRLLEGFGTIDMASSGAEGLKMIENHDYDLIILDVGMPEMDGFEVCKRLKSTPSTSGIPIVFLTAGSANNDEERALEIGATDFIRKPISPQVLSARVSNILKLQATTRELEVLALTDSLTNAYNRRFFMKAGSLEVHRSKRYKQPFTVLMLDIDHFKVVNDTYGHGVGDEALIRAVSVIQSSLRGEDTLGRIGGEEFAVIFPQTTKTSAALVAERIRGSIENIVIDSPLGPVKFTISIGLSEGMVSDSSIDDVLRRADCALYEAKESGRNKVVSL